MTTGLIICGALGHEVVELVARRGWDVEITAVPAQVHLFPDQIAPKVEAKIEEWRATYDRLIVLFGDCGSSGGLDRMLQKFPDIERIAGPHCYEMYGGERFQQLMDEEPGTFFLTDFMVRGFWTMILKGMGLDRYPELKEIYFANYSRLVYLVQKPDPERLKMAHAIANYLGLPLQVEATGYNQLEARLEALLNKNIEPETKA